MKKENSSVTKILYFVIGTRAQLIKTAPVMRKMELLGIPYFSIYTGQHKETIEDIWQDFGVRLPDVTLGKSNIREVNTVFGLLYWWFLMLGLLVRPKKILKKGKGIIVTHGDTITTVWGALLGKLSGNQVAHLESGLRSFNIFHPFPEEINRIITFLCADYYFCPNDWAIGNLRKFNGVKINTMGNTLLDAVRLAQTKNTPVPFVKKPYCLISMHRFENLYGTSRLIKNIEIIEGIATWCHCVFILHPVTKKRLVQTRLFDRLEKNKNITLQNRLSFFKFIRFVSESEFLVTDGGSNQEESSYLGLPCLLLRHKTERIEGLDENVVLSDYDQRRIEDFKKTYKKYRNPPVASTESPAGLIADYLDNARYS